MRPQAPSKIFGYNWKKDAGPGKRRMKGAWSVNPPTPPESYSCDSQWPTIQIPDLMYGNDVLGICVMAGRGHQSNRLLVGEYGQDNLNIVLATVDQVKAEYFLETGGQDTGLCPDESLELWRTNGWMVGTPAINRKIAAWGRVDGTDQLDIMLAIWQLYGVQIDINLPNFWINEFNNNGIWDVPSSSQVNSPDYLLNPNQGHNVYSYSYNKIGPIIDTWGAEIQSTWAGIAWAASEANGGEVEAVVRQNDAGVAVDVDGLDVGKLQAELNEIKES